MGYIIMKIIKKNFFSNAIRYITNEDMNGNSALIYLIFFQDGNYRITVTLLNNEFEHSGVKEYSIYNFNNVILETMLNYFKTVTKEFEIDTPYKSELKLIRKFKKEIIKSDEMINEIFFDRFKLMGL